MESPTLTKATTREGVTLGTPAYMSPEQARGQTLDKRTDVWSFGCVLYEVLTGQRAFLGQTTSDTLVSVLEREPDWAALPRSLPPAVHSLVHRCTRKDKEQRLHDIADARIELEEALVAGASVGSAVVPTRQTTRWRPSLGAALAVALLGRRGLPSRSELALAASAESRPRPRPWRCCPSTSSTIRTRREISAWVSPTTSSRISRIWRGFGSGPLARFCPTVARPWTCSKPVWRSRRTTS